MRPRDKTAEECTEVARPVLGGRNDLKKLEALMRRDVEKPALFPQSVVNYAAAPAGGQVYDSNWVASNTTGLR